MTGVRDRKRGTPARAGAVRIIGGRWRGRRIAVTALDELRPTPDRTRETLFNWLAADIRGARCLDLFAGTGVLGLEALSRGAATLVAVERNRQVADALRSTSDLLGAGEQTRVYTADALSWLSRSPQPFDLVFIDPPYQLAPYAAVFEALQGGWLAPGAKLYVESDSEDAERTAPGHWARLRAKAAGQVRYYLFAA